MSKRVLFVCTGNTCRGPMAEYLGRSLYPEIQFSSAGFIPQEKEDARWAVDTLRIHYGIDASGHVPKKVTLAMVVEADLRIALDTENAARIRSAFQYEPEIEDLFDPYGSNDIEKYHLCCRSIVKMLARHFGKPSE